MQGHRDVLWQEAKYCLALGSFIFIRSIKAYIYQDSKQLPLLTTSTLFSHSCCIRAKRRGEAAFNAIYTWRHNSTLRGPVLLKKQGMIWLYWQEREVSLFFPHVFPLQSRPSTKISWHEVHVWALFCSNLPFTKRERLSAKTVTTLIICTTIFAIRHSK